MMKRRIVILCLTAILYIFSSVSVFAADLGYTIISPVITTSSSIICSDTLLISIKVSQGKKMNISIYHYPESTTSTSSSIDTATGVLVSGPHTFTSNNQLNFFSTQISDVKPGLYALKIDTLDSAGQVSDTSKQYFVTKGKQDETPADKLFEAEPSNALQFFQNLFKNIFGN